jgi:hypothetical protein
MIARDHGCPRRHHPEAAQATRSRGWLVPEPPPVHPGNHPDQRRRVPPVPDLCPRRPRPQKGNRSMNLPEYVRAIADAAERFEKSVTTASEQYRGEVLKAREAFFEDDNKPMVREDYAKEIRR